jgi:hypothetical protein
MDDVASHEWLEHGLPLHYSKRTRVHQNNMSIKHPKTRESHLGN